MAANRFDSVLLGPVHGTSQVASQPVGEAGVLPIPTLTHVGEVHMQAFPGFLGADQDVDANNIAGDCLIYVHFGA